MSDLTPSVLIVDDEPAIRDMLRSALEREGYRCLCAAGGEEALSILSQEEIQLILLDVNMPGMTGIEVLQRVQESSSDAAVIMVTANADRDTAIEAMKLGATDYIAKPFKLSEVLVSSHQALERRQLILENREFHENLQEKVRAQTVEIRKQKDTIDALFLDTIAAWAVALEAKDRYTEGHSRRVADYGVMLAKRLDQSEDFLRELERGGLLHDIGKIGTPDAVLSKEGKLTPEEFEEMKKHTVHGWAIVKRIRHMSDLVAQCVRSHHERWDGSGYPDGLRGSDVPFAGRIIALADAFDAMTSTRSYRNALTVQQALEQVDKFKGTQFDPQLAETFLELMNQDRGSGGNILVVDDDRSVTELIQASLLPQGHRVVVSNSGYQALRRVVEEPFDIIYLDLNMPGIDGAQTLHALRELRSDLFVVIITGLPDDPRVTTMMREGAVSCLPKPFGVRDIIAMTSKFLKEKKERAGAA